MTAEQLRTLLYLYYHAKTSDGIVFCRGKQDYQVLRKLGFIDVDDRGYGKINSVGAAFMLEVIEDATRRTDRCGSGASDGRQNGDGDRGIVADVGLLPEETGGNKVTWTKDVISRLFEVDAKPLQLSAEGLSKTDKMLVDNGYCKVVCNVLTTSGEGEALIKRVVFSLRPQFQGRD